MADMVVLRKNLQWGPIFMLHFKQCQISVYLNKCNSIYNLDVLLGKHSLMLHLKDKTTSVPDKLKLSKFAWGSDAVHIPNKQQQLLDFVCGLLVNKKKHGLQGTDVVLTWKTLLIFLQVSGESVYIKPSILQAVLDDLGKMSKAAESNSKETILGSSLLQVVVSCACCLLRLPSVLSAQFDLLCSVLAAACNLKSSLEQAVMEDIERLIMCVLPALLKCQRSHLNQAQVLHTVLEKALAPILGGVKYCSDQLSQSLQDFLLTCLLHSDHLESYGVYLRHSCGEPIPGQPKQPPKIMMTLFTSLASLADQPSTNTATIKFVPLMLQAFLKEKKSEPRLCFLMLRRLVKLVSPSLGKDLANFESTGNTKAQLGKAGDVTKNTDQVRDRQWLEGVALCLNVCKNEADLDLFSASRQSGDILLWFSKLMQLVLQQERHSQWYDCMRHVLGLNHLVVEKSWHTVLQHCLVSSPQNTDQIRAAQDLFLSELVSVYVKLRRTSDLLTALMSACQSCQDKVNAIQQSQLFYIRLCDMFSEVPFTGLLEMWEKVQAETVLLVGGLTSQLLPEEKPKALSHLDWILTLYTALLDNARLFDHRSAGAFSGRISGLVNSVESCVIAPLYKIKEVRKGCSGLPHLLRTWVHLQAMLLPRWREEDNHGSKNEEHVEKLIKWIKKLEGVDQAKISLQRVRVASPLASPLLMMQDSEGEGSTLELAVENLLQLPPLTLENVVSISSGGAVSQFNCLCSLLPLAGKRLPQNLLHGCADLVLSILKHGHLSSWLEKNTSEPFQRGQTTLLSLARNLLRHPAMKELRPFQQRLATQALAQLLEGISFVPCRPVKKAKKVDLDLKTLSPGKDLFNFLTHCEQSCEEINDINLSKISAEVSLYPKSVEMVKILLSLDLEYLPEVNLRCQVGSALLLSGLSSGCDCDQVKSDLEHLYVRSLCVPNTSQLFKLIQPAQLLKFALEYSVQKPAVRSPMLEVTVQAVMYEHRAVLNMPYFVKELLSGLGDDTTRSGCVRFRLLALMAGACHKYLKKAFHLQEVGEAAKEVYFCVAKYVIKHGLSWFHKVQDTTSAHREKNLSERKYNQVGKDLRKKKRKRERSETEEERDKSERESTQGEEKRDGESGLMAEAWDAMLSCFTRVLDLWEEQVAESKVNEHLTVVVAEIVAKILGRPSDRVEATQVLFIQSCCYCQLRSRDVSLQETYLLSEQEGSKGLQLLTPDTCTQLWTICFSQACQTVHTRLGERPANPTSLTRTAIPVPPENTKNFPGKASETSVAERTAWFGGVGDLGPATDTMCALLESVAAQTFAVLYDKLLDCLMVSADWDPAAVIVAVDVWRKLMASSVLSAKSSTLLFKKMYQLLSSLLSVVQNIAHFGDLCKDGAREKKQQLQHTSELYASGHRVACRCIVRALADFADLGKALVTPRMTLLCLHAGFSLDLAQPADVEVMCRLLNNLLVRHANTVLSAVPAVLDLVNKLVRSVMSLGGQERLARAQAGETQSVTHCAQLVTRLLTLLSSATYKADLQKVAHSVLAEYLMGVQKQTLHTGVKAELLRGLYKLMAVSDKFRLAALNAALPAGVKDTFKLMHQEYNKYHRYTGAV